MAVYLSESDVDRLLSVSDAVEILSRCFRDWGEGKAENLSRRRLHLPKGTFHLMAGALPHRGYLGLKAYTSWAPTTRFYVLLFSADSGELLAMMEADQLGRKRTGAASGAATDLLSQHDSTIAAVIGTGGQALTQVEALLAVRPIREIRVFSRTREHREAFASKLRTSVASCPLVVLAETGEAAVAGAHIITTITTSREPALMGDWLAPGQHINAAGANSISRRELDTRAISRCDVVTVDSLEQAALESGDLVVAHEMRHLPWSHVIPLAQIAAGHHPGRTSPDQITPFKSLGIGLEDVAVAAHVYEEARALGVGSSFP